MGDAENTVSSSTVQTLVQAGQIQNLYYVNADREHREAPRLVPSPPYAFTDRGPTLKAIDQAVNGGRLRGQISIVGFHGPPGVGKRAVTRHWLRTREPDYPDGLFHADFGAGPADPGLVAEKLREFLLEVGYAADGLPGSAAGLAARFRSWSAGKRIAVVLDNVWGAAQIRPFLPGPGASTVLFTSPARISGLLGEGAVLLEVPLLEAGFAEELLTGLIGADRARAEPAATRELIALCDGLPMAMWVLAASSNALPSRPLSRLLTDLRDEERRHRLLGPAGPSGTESDVTVFADAFRRLSPEARVCCRALGLHPGPAGATLPALAAGLDLPADEVQDALDEIEGLHLAETLRPGPDAAVRYRMHQLIGLYAPSAPEFDDEPVLERLLSYYQRRAVLAGYAMMPLRGWAELLFPGLVDDELPAPEEARQWLESERGTLRACAELFHRRGEYEELCRLAVMLWPLHEQGKHLADQIAVNQLALEAADQLGEPALVALIRVQLGFPYLHQGQPEQAEPLFEAALTPARASGQPELEATVLESLGLARLALGKTADARDTLRENLDRALAIGSARRIALARFHLGKVEAVPVAAGLQQEALDTFEALDPPDGYNAAKTRIWLGRSLTGLGSFDRAEAVLRQALATLLELRRPFDCVQTLEALGDLGAARDDRAAAAVAYRDGLAIAEAGDLAPETDRLRGKLAGTLESGTGSIGADEALDGTAAEPNP